MDTSNTDHATAMVATRALGKALGAIRSIPGMSPRYAVQGWQSANDSVAEYDGAERISQVLATPGDRRNLASFGEFPRKSRRASPRQDLFFTGTGTPAIFTPTEKRVLRVVK